MAASINASTTAGVVTTADTSGVLNIQTANTTAISISASQVVSYTNNPTYSGGTANGVLYLNGSKVATSGSALTYNGTTLTAVNNASAVSIGLSRTSATARDYALGIDGDGGFRLTDSTGSVVVLSSLPSIAFLASAGDLYFKANNTEGMRLTSTGLGIGTSSPANKLQVVASSSGTNDLLTISRFDRGSSGTAANGLGGRLEFSAQDNAGSQRTAAWLNWKLADVSSGGPKGYLSLGSRGTSEALIIDDSGNLGLGVTPSAGYRASIKGNYSSIVGGIEFDNGGGDKTVLGFASATSPSFIISNQSASGVLRFDTNNTERMRLDASGNLGVGTTSPSTRLHAKGSGGTIATFERDASGTIAYFNRNAGSGNAGAIIGADSVAGYFAGGNSTSNMVYLDSVNNLAQFYTNGSERARIDSSGNLLVGTTNNNIGGTTTTGINATASGVLRAGATDNASLLLNRINSDGTIAFFQRQGTTVGTISVTGSATAYNTSSDYRLKENIQPMQNALDVVAQLNPVTYNWKVDGSASQGFIAHELQAVVPDCVTGEKDAVDAEGNPVYQGIDTSFLVATLTAAIKEQQALIQTLTARIDVLEGAKQ